MIRNSKKRQKKSKQLRKREQFVKNLRENWFLPLSSAALGLVEFEDSTLFWASLMAAITIVACFAGFTDPLIPWARNESKEMRCIALIASIGVCYRSQQFAYLTWNACFFPAISGVSTTVNPAFSVSIVLAVLSFPIAYLGTLYIWRTIWAIAKPVIPYKKQELPECIVYICILLVMLHYSGYVLSTSNAFYGGRLDLIYTSDSPQVDMRMSYLYINDIQNQITQPLFAVFAAPFISIPYLVGAILMVPYNAMAVMINGIQIIMLFVSWLMLAKAMELKGGTRIAWVILCCCTYATLLFSIMMEQYIVAVFWISAIVCQTCSTGVCQRTVIWGAAGSAITSIIFIPLACKDSILTEFRKKTRNVFFGILGFIALMLAFYKLYVFYRLGEYISLARTFSGESVAWSDHILQFLSFISSCFVAPSAGVTDWGAWRLSPVVDVNWLGYLILMLTGIGACITWRKRSSRIAAGWVMFSIVFVLLVGYGTAENGTNLYALYFGWAYFMLLFELVRTIGMRLKWNWLLPVIISSVSLLLLSINVPALQGLYEYAISYFPV